MSLLFGAGNGSRWRGVPWVLLGLVYLIRYPAGDIFGKAHTTGYRVAATAALVAFVVTFVALTVSHMPWQKESSRTTLVLLGVAAAMTVIFPFLLGGEWTGLSVYVSVACAMTLPPQRAFRGVLACAVLTCVLCLATGVGGASVALLVFQVFTLGIMLIAFRQTRILVRELQEARGEVARLAASDERLRIARDLHDLLGHTLSLIVLKSEVASRIADRDLTRSLAEVKDIETVARQALTDVREAVAGYRQRDLSSELDNARGVLAAAGVEVTIRTSGTPLPDHLDGLFGWAVREGITNIVRHARAQTCTIAITRDAGQATLDITNDGPTTTAASATNGTGLLGLTERVTETGGTVRHGPTPTGFTLTVQAPLAPAPTLA